MDSYDRLGISKDATEEEIDAAYKSKIKEVHPDVGGSKKDFIQVNNAYNKIKFIESDAEKSISEKLKNKFKNIFD